MANSVEDLWFVLYTHLFAAHDCFWVSWYSHASVPHKTFKRLTS